MNGPQNVLMGDSQAIELPQAQINEEDIKEERRKAKYAKSKDYQELKGRADARKKFYQTYLPDGRPLTGKESLEELGKMWMVANAVIAEIDLVFTDYETIANVVEEAENGKN